MPRGESPPRDVSPRPRREGLTYTDEGAGVVLAIPSGSCFDAGEEPGPRRTAERKPRTHGIRTDSNNHAREAKLGYLNAAACPAGRGRDGQAPPVTVAGPTTHDRVIGPSSCGLEATTRSCGRACWSLSSTWTCSAAAGSA